MSRDISELRPISNPNFKKPIIKDECDLEQIVLNDKCSKIPCSKTVCFNFVKSILEMSKQLSELVFFEKHLLISWDFSFSDSYFGKMYLSIKSLISGIFEKLSKLEGLSIINWSIKFDNIGQCNFWKCLNSLCISAKPFDVIIKLQFIVLSILHWYDFLVDWFLDFGIIFVKSLIIK